MTIAKVLWPGLGVQSDHPCRPGCTWIGDLGFFEANFFPGVELEPAGDLFDRRVELRKCRKHPKTLDKCLL
jgi:hypothetical protein